MLNNTIASRSTLATEVGNGNGEGKLVSRDCGSVGGINVPADKRRPYHGVGGRIDDTDIGGASVRCLDIVRHGNNLTSGVALDVGRVVLKLVTLAKVEIALGGEIALDQLHLPLNVACGVGLLVVEDLLSAGSLHGRTDNSSGRRGNIAMASDQGDDGSGENSKRAHFE